MRSFGLARLSRRGFGTTTTVASASSGIDAKIGVLSSAVDPSSADYKENHVEMTKVVDDLKEKVAQITRGGGEKARERHTSRGKLLPRDRVSGLLDQGSPFLELSQLAAYDMYGADDLPAAGIITGIGRVSG